VIDVDFNALSEREPAEPSHLPIDLVRTFSSEGMKARRVAKLQGNGPHLLEPLIDSSQSP
jgi:hypothetical protein